MNCSGPSPYAILASNSSSYPTSQLIDAVSRPGRVVNTHYCRGLPELNVVEVMSCGKTTDEVIARLFERLPTYGLLPFHVRKESVGFIFNRIWAAIRPGIPAEPRQLLRRYIEQGRLGIKSGKGFYSDYEEKAPTR